MKRIIFIIISVATLGVAALLFWRWYSKRAQNGEANPNEDSPSTEKGFPVLSSLVASAVQGVARVTKCMGNIRQSAESWVGKVGSYSGFEAFSDWAYGTRATIITLRTYYDKHGLKTIQGIISRWAPSSENNTDAYITQVSLWSKKGSDAQLSRSDLPLIAACICRMETGLPEANFEAVKEHCRDVNSYFNLV